MRCSEFLSQYSDFRDGRLDTAALGEMRLHLAECVRCGNYQARIGRGVDLFKTLSSIQVPPGFSRRIATSVRTAGDEPEPVTPARAGVAGAAMIAAALTLMVTGPQNEAPRQERAAATQQLLPTTIATPSTKPYLTFVDLSPDVLHSPYHTEQVDTTRTLAEYLGTPNR